MQFSRQSPSPRYLELVNLYNTLHNEGEISLGLPAEQTFPGKSLIPHVYRIKKLIDKYNVKTLLDYGSGKGIQYLADALTSNGEMLDENTYKNPDNISLQQFWKLDEIKCYDPAYEPFMSLPEHPSDMVVCTDVLEHCPEQDIDWILDEMFGFAGKCLYANVACYPAKKTLPNGENAHCTIQPVEWWHNKIIEVSDKHPDVMFQILVLFERKDEKGQIQRTKATITNLPPE